MGGMRYILYLIVHRQHYENTTDSVLTRYSTYTQIESRFGFLSIHYVGYICSRFAFASIGCGRSLSISAEKLDFLNKPER